ncbi:MAG: bacteriohemerythrin [Chromatiales bacterium]|nr:bacteriohemerythrin [Chromatiales bacterium]
MDTKKITWSDDFSVGVTALDDQHKNLIEIINKLAVASQSSVDSEAVSDVLAEMHEYTKSHLDFEEQLLETHGYPDLEHHKAEHSEFMGNIGEFSIAVMNHHQNAPENILKYLYEWFGNHILIEDKKYVPFFKSKNVT